LELELDLLNKSIAENLRHELIREDLSEMVPMIDAQMFVSQHSTSDKRKSEEGYEF
jgi:hypothetical protein